MSAEQVTVGLDERSYRIIIGERTLSCLGGLCRETGLGSQVAIVTNPTVASFYLQQVCDSLTTAGLTVTVVEIPDGEQFKVAETVLSIYTRLVESGIDRSGFLVALGGGVVGDIAGFAAATYLRGVPFVQVPTTLLAQVDSSVGGKTGFNLPQGKNLIGAFYQPRLVLIDPTVLDTLPQREYVAGLAETIKYGVSLDPELFTVMETNVDGLQRRDKAVLQQVIATACKLKASVVEKDEREAGLRAVLNYGHTFGHAIETLTGYGQYLHGEAVAIGMAQAARLSQLRGLATVEDTERIISLIQRFSLSTSLPPFTATEYAEALSHDKKKRDDAINFVFNRGIGDFSIEKVTDLKELLLQCGIGGRS